MLQKLFTVTILESDSKITVVRLSQPNLKKVFKKVGPCVSKPGCMQVRMLKAVKSNWKLKEPLTTSYASWLLLSEIQPQSRNGM